ncbi:MAG TPA: DEAD/DEAH box helicase [Polyangiaceae bacterium]|nr:DEAD/DEAH box helicase [Polyangiaceae bacterium]
MAPETESTSLPTFDVLPLSSELRKAVDDLGYVHPTPVQRAVFEPASRGRDLVVQARTGTGKTAAFGLPLIDAVVRRKEARVQALVLCPTRELALQVTRELDALAKHRGTKVVAIYGGAPMPRQVEQIRDGAQILVGTPGRVLDHLSRGTLDPSSIRAAVLDESDEMLSMGFLPQITEIFSQLPDSKQTLLFSATLPADIRRMAETRLKNAEFITLSGDHIGALEIQHFVYLSRGDKLAEFVQVIETDNPESAIVFCNTRDETKRVAAGLNQQGYAADWLNADLPQNDRERVMAATRQGKLRFLVCTDVASRGIDISHLTHVINFDFPESAESYVHRTGRTGRAGRTGTAISLIEPRDIGNLYILRLTYKLKPIERQLPSATELKTRAESDLVRWFVEGVGQRKVHPDDLALARRLLSHEQAELVVAGLLRDHLGARPDAQDDATAARRTRMPKPAESGSEGAGAPQRTEAAPLPRAGARAPGPARAAAPAPAPARVPARIAAPAPVASPVPRAAPSADAGGRPSAESSSASGGVTATPIGLVSAPVPTRAAPAPIVPPLPRAVLASAAHVDPLATAPTVAAAPPQLAVPRVRSESGSPRVVTPSVVPAGDVVEIYASVGRRHGAKPSDYEHLLQARGVPAESVVYVRVRHRNAFVAVDRGEVDRVLSALDGATVAGRTVKAELSRGGTDREPDDAESDDAI